MHPGFCFAALDLKPGVLKLFNKASSLPLLLALPCSACHIWGSRPYATPDLSTNCGWLALPTFGVSHACC